MKTRAQRANSSGLSIPDAGQWLLFNAKNVPGGLGGAFGAFRVERCECPEFLMDALAAQMIAQNALPPSGLQGVADLINGTMCQRPGIICRKPAEAGLVGSPAMRLQGLSPTDYGRAAWRMMHMQAARDPFVKRDWEAQINIVRRMLHSAQATGCIQCYETMVNHIALHPFSAVKTAADAARWTHELHNTVNRKLSKPVVSYQAGAIHYGWPMQRQDQQNQQKP